MLRTLLCAAAAAGMSMIIPTYGQEYYTHNGSLVELVWEDAGDGFQIRYVNPRRGLPVAPGTLLVHGAWTAGGHIYGTAYIFSSECGAFPYRVEGTATRNGFVLNGPAPIRGRGCQIVDYQWNNNSTLRFTN